VEKEVLKNEIHEGLEEMACSDCHNPHGGEDMNFLY
jgi:predicted CXXCH cytochrome family protein